MDNQFENYMDIPKELFEKAPIEGKIHDKSLETKPIGYFKDAFIRFRKNKSSIVAAIIVIILVIYALIGPLCFHKNYINSYETDKDLRKYKHLLPKIALLEGSGIWDGSKVEDISESRYYMYMAMGMETGYSPIQSVLDTYYVTNSDGTKSRMYRVRTNTYYAIDCFTLTFTQEQYDALQEWQNQNNIQIILPWVDYKDDKSTYDLIKNSKVELSNLNVWYECNKSGNPTIENGQLKAAYRTSGTKDFYNSIRIDGDPGIEDPSSTSKYKYASVTGSKTDGYSFTCRINAYNYFEYKYGFAPAFTFGTDSNGYDIFTRLASGARFSLVFAVAVSAINLMIGAVYGAIEGYYGGAADMIMERISDILASIPNMVVCVLFNLHLSGKVGTVPALLYAFIMTGWIGMAGTTRMQFYRFKNQEYVLAARTLGAKDRRIMFKHIFPNSLGTIITGSVLSIPGVIFSETSLTYLGIINLDSPTRSSVGAMLNAGKDTMDKTPHLVLFPAIFIGLLMISFNLFGNGLRDAFNPSLRGVED